MAQLLINGIPPKWRDIFVNHGMNELKKALNGLRPYGPKFEELCPAPENIFRAFQLVDPDMVRVVIIGQDPYHTPGVADGLCFSTQDDKIPPSLKNIYKTLKNNELIHDIDHSCLQNWAVQGTLLLNSALTTEESIAGKHTKIWKDWTMWLMDYLSDNYDDLIFVLWGNHAQNIGKNIDETKHYVYKWSHPSPLAQSGPEENKFIHCDHFSRISDLYEYLYGAPFNWNVSINTTIYTDGSCKGNGKIDAIGGFGVYFQSGLLKGTKIYGPTQIMEHNGEIMKITNNRSELTAICEGLEYYYKRGCVGNLTLVTDSELCMNIINLWIEGWHDKNIIDDKKNPDLIWRLWGVLSNVRHFQRKIGLYFKIIHVNSHIPKNKIPEKGTKQYKLYEGNDIADNLANKGESIKSIIIDIPSS